ncbi:myb family transcription factor MPH1-like isoform X2 [Magnolia sinica]|nr:myb family transcription factor MPH1-like isoform X2 [Magnolia sinica]
MGVEGLGISHVKSHLQMYRSSKNGAGVEAFLSMKGLSKRRRMHHKNVGIFDSSSCSEDYHPRFKSGHCLLQSPLLDGVRAWESKHGNFFWREERTGTANQLRQLCSLDGMPNKQTAGGPCHNSCELSLSITTSEVRRSANKGESSSTVEIDTSEEGPPQSRKHNVDMMSHKTLKENDINLDLTISSTHYCSYSN